jgi:prepilin-type N-terminal cleavage/methylation domain-containing protein
LNLPKNSKGFTLIEIVIVIAIAALILAAILIFVPQAQKSQRDGDRKQASAKVLSKLVECAGNNGGQLCGSGAGALSSASFNSNYMTGINQPGGTQYTANFGTAQNSTSCTPSANVYVSAGSNPSSQVVQVCLEAPGTWYQAGQ